MSQNHNKLNFREFATVGLGLIFGNICQLIGLPLFLGSLKGVFGVYFVLAWCSLLFNLYFWPIVYYRIKKNIITPEMRNYPHHWKLVLIGICDALNGLCIVYASLPSRTPGSLQAILVQSVIPLTLVFSSMLLRKSYNRQQYLGASITFLGIALSLVPTIVSLELGNFDLYWPLIFLFGCVPGVLMNILEEMVFIDNNRVYDNYYLLAWESLYQLITVLLLFWIDLIAPFGTSANVDEWWRRIVNGLTCFFTPWLVDVKDPDDADRCNYCALSGIFFTMAYCFSYVYGASMMKKCSANTTAIVQAVCPALVVIFWIMFVDLNKWAGGKPYDDLKTICYLCAIPILGAGAVIFRKAEERMEEERLLQTNSEISHN